VPPVERIVTGRAASLIHQGFGAYPLLPLCLRLTVPSSRLTEALP
jgi:hypothetical protein